ncbi:MAG: hypothetical protein Q4B69_07395, partial [Slackia sp.]|nr:hypothetical protein [Slackia sp.]
MKEFDEHNAFPDAARLDDRRGVRDFILSIAADDPSQEEGRSFFREPSDMRPRDWAIDVAAALLAFAFGCVQLALASTSVIYVDGPFREMAGLVNIVPNGYAYAALAFTTFPLVIRRIAAWPTLGIVLACFFFSSGFMSGYALSAVGPI